MSSALPARVPPHLNAAPLYSRIFEALDAFTITFAKHIDPIYNVNATTGMAALTDKELSDPKFIEAMKAIAPTLRELR